jgi:lipoate-protein ligase B
MPPSQHLASSCELGRPDWSSHVVSTPLGEMLIHHRPNWAYDDALAWMDQTRASVLAGGQMEIAIGTHSEEVVSLGAHAPVDQIRRPDLITDRQAIIRRTERGGGATCHEPGQIVLYPVVSMGRLGMSVPIFTENLLNAVCSFLMNFGLKGDLSLSSPGVYVDNLKIASVGFRARKRVITHGLAINYVNTMDIFGAIDACGDASLRMGSVIGLLREMRQEEKIKPLEEAMKLIESSFLMLCMRAAAD